MINKHDRQIIRSITIALNSPKGLAYMFISNISPLFYSHKGRILEKAEIRKSLFLKYSICKYVQGIKVSYKHLSPIFTTELIFEKYFLSVRVRNLKFLGLGCALVY